MIIGTWNMQGADGGYRWSTGVRGLLGDGQADVLLLQECGSPPGSAVPTGAPPWTGPRRPRGALATFYDWRPGSSTRGGGASYFMMHAYWGRANNRCSLAIITKTPPDGVFWVVNPLTAASRPMIGIEMETPGGNSFFLGTLHAFSGSGNDGPRFLQAIKRLSGRAGWLCAGDFNREPDGWGAPARAGGRPPNIPVGSKIWPPGDITYPSSGRKLDYAVSALGGETTGSVMSSLVNSDHLPVLYEI